jgi:oligopeptide/dipeptide ABC transporter ATP-binding protein
VVLRIEGLKTYFHTYEGTVRALEGIDLEIRSGETVGLVGETGCGKSVTALSVLRLIPTPPGQIEGGRVFLQEPEDVRRLREDYDRVAFERLRKKGIEANASSVQVREVLQPEIEALNAEMEHSVSDDQKAELRARLQAATSEYDILQKPIEDVRGIRGNKISMIFQEPMTALNPVFTIGDQIAETLILHSKAELCRDVLTALDLQIAARSKKVRGKRLTVVQARERFRTDGGSPAGENRTILERLEGMKDDERVCSACWCLAPQLWDYCPSCGARLTLDWWAPFRGSIMSMEKRLYSRMLADPQDQLVDFVNTVRVLRRLVRSRLRDEGVRWAVRMLGEVKIAEPERIAGQYPFELSGGMRQRSMIAMMMACNPMLLIADEPTTALDVTVEAQILKLMKELQTKTNMAILLITHDLGIVAEICDKVGVMYAGSIAEFGTTEQVFHQMMHPYTNGLMQSIPRFKGMGSQERKRALYIIHGTVPNLLHPPPGCRFHPRCPRALEMCKEKSPPLEELEPGHLVACHNPVPRGEGVP